MDSSSSSSWNTSREKFTRRVISPSIKGKTCSICLTTLTERRTAVVTVCKHAYCLACIYKWSCLKRNCPLCNAHFDSWYCKIDLASGYFVREHLPPLRDAEIVKRERESLSINHRRSLRRAREELSISRSRSRSRSFPWRRSFGRPDLVPVSVINERKLQWRASVYARCLQAVPFSSMISLEQSISVSAYSKEKLQRRIEPWIRRELQALLGDPDPSIIVHVASSLFIASIERKYTFPLRADDDLFSPLMQFLNDKTNMFLHELRCFAECSFTIETYDAVVEYKELNT